MTKKKGLIILLILLITIAVTTVPFVYAYFYQETEVSDTDRTFGEVKVSVIYIFQMGLPRLFQLTFQRGMDILNKVFIMLIFLI